MDSNWRPKGWENPYGAEWFTSACQAQYSLGEAFEQVASTIIPEVLKELEERVEPEPPYCVDKGTGD